MSINDFEALTARLYEQVGRPRDDAGWDAIRPLYHPRATLVRTGVDDNGKRFALAMTLDEYIANVKQLLADVEFSEVELFQRVDEFGNVARLASVYEFRYRGGGEDRNGRGVNFFNLVNDGRGWQVMNMVWDNERHGLSLHDAGLHPTL
jgi:hypothetical protein